MLKRLVDDFWLKAFAKGKYIEGSIEEEIHEDTVGTAYDCRSNGHPAGANKTIFENVRVLVSEGGDQLLAWNDVTCVLNETELTLSCHLVNESTKESTKQSDFSRIHVSLCFSDILHFVWFSDNCIRMTLVNSRDEGCSQYEICCCKALESKALYEVLVWGLVNASTILFTSGNVQIDQFDESQHQYVSLADMGQLKLYKKSATNSLFLIAVDASHHLLFHLFICPNICYRSYISENRFELWVAPSGSSGLMLYSIKVASKDDISVPLSFMKEVAMSSHTNFFLNFKNEGAEEVAEEQQSNDFVDRDEFQWYSERGGETDEEEGEEGDDRICAHSDLNFINKLMKIDKYNIFTFKMSQKKEIMLSIQRNNDNASQARGLHINDSKFYFKGKHVIPETAAFFKNDQAMLLTDASDASKVHLMDLQKEKIVQTWKDDSLKIHSMLEDKYSCASPVILGYTSDTLFSLDTRHPTKVEGPRLNYAHDTHFTCGAVDGSGHLLLGSGIRGDLRFYDGNANANGYLKRAKTLIRGMGEPIRYVSVTMDGRWILATCTDSLLLYCVTSTENSEETAFTHACANKMQPFVTLKLMDLLKDAFATKPAFTKAEFDKSEAFIVAIAGPFAYIWNFNDVKKGITHIYKVYERGEPTIVDMGTFETEANHRVVVVTPTTVKSSHLRWM